MAESASGQPILVVDNPAEFVRRLTLNRPDLLNSFNRAMARELSEALESIAANDQIRAVLLTGAGRGFCAGQTSHSSFSNKADICQTADPKTRSDLWILPDPLGRSGGTPVPFLRTEFIESQGHGN